VTAEVMAGLEDEHLRLLTAPVALEPEDTLVTEVTGAGAMDIMALAAAALDYSDEVVAAQAAAAQTPLVVLAEEEEEDKKAEVIRVAADQEVLVVKAVGRLVLVEHMGVVPVQITVVVAI